MKPLVSLVQKVLTALWGHPKKPHVKQGSGVQLVRSQPPRMHVHLELMVLEQDTHVSMSCHQDLNLNLNDTFMELY